MPKIIQKLTDGLMSTAKALPLIAGATVGMVVPPKGYPSSPVKSLIDGQVGTAIGGLMDNYAFYDAGSAKFDMSKGIGAKALVVGIVVHKIIGAITEA